MSSKPAVISVIGSLNVDLVTRTARVPVAGETLASESFNIGWGGKGANQAVACARLSRTKATASASRASDVEVRMVGAVGDDEFHQGFLESLRADGLNTSGVEILKGKKTGVAVIVVETQSGENRIMFNPGANGEVVVRDLVDDDVGVALFQLELPMQVVLHNMKLAREKGVETVINPAPAVPLPAEAYAGLGHLIVNETEAAILSGIEKPTSWDEVAAVFIARGVENVIITLGGEVSHSNIRHPGTMDLLMCMDRAFTTRRQSNREHRNRVSLCPLARSRSLIRRPLVIPLREPTPLPSHAGRLWRKALTSISMLLFHRRTERHL